MNLSNMGTLYIANDFELAQNVLYTGGKIIILDEGFEETSPPGIIMASILLPPYQALGQLVDGDMETFANMYTEYLFSPDPDSFISLIVTCLFKGVNIIMYTPDGFGSLEFFPVLANYILNVYGITIGGPNNPFIFNPAFLSSVLNVIYKYGLITTPEFISLWPQNVPISEEIVQKMMQEINPTLPDYNFNTCYDFCVAYMRVCLEHGVAAPLFTKGGCI